MKNLRETGASGFYYLRLKRKIINLITRKKKTPNNTFAFEIRNFRVGIYIYGHRTVILIRSCFQQMLKAVI